VVEVFTATPRIQKVVDVEPNLLTAPESIPNVIEYVDEPSVQVSGLCRKDEPIRKGGIVQAANLIHQVKPEYPPFARAARVQGRKMQRSDNRFLACEHLPHLIRLPEPGISLLSLALFVFVVQRSGSSSRGRAHSRSFSTAGQRSNRGTSSGAHSDALGRFHVPLMLGRRAVLYIVRARLVLVLIHSACLPGGS